MTRYLVVTSRDDAMALRALARKLLGLPRRGTHLGGGTHVTMTDDPQSPGWSRQHGVPLRHPTEQLWAYPIDDAMRDTWRDHQDRLSASERQFVLAHLSSEADLSAEWNMAAEESEPARNRAAEEEPAR